MAIAQPVLEQLRAAATAYASGKPVPNVDGLTLVPHGSPDGFAWYFEIRPNLPRPPVQPSTGLSGRGGERGPGRSQGREIPGGGPPDGGPAAGPPGDGPPPAGPGGPTAESPAAATSGSGRQQVTVLPKSSGQQEGPRATPSPLMRAAFAKFRATLSCAYFSALSQAAAVSAGYTAFTGRNGLGYAPHIGLFAVRAPELGTGGGSLKH